MRLLFALIVASLPFFQCFGQVVAPDLYTKNSLVTVEVSQVIGMPVTLSNPNVVTDFGRDISKVSFDLRVLDPTTEAVQIQVVIFDMTGEVKGGESWPIGGRSCAKPAKLGEITPVSSGIHTGSRPPTEAGRSRGSVGQQSRDGG